MQTTANSFNETLLQATDNPEKMAQDNGEMAGAMTINAPETTDSEPTTTVLGATSIMTNSDRPFQALAGGIKGLANLWTHEKESAKVGHWELVTNRNDSTEPDTQRKLRPEN